MIELLDTTPAIQIDPVEYVRLLGFPPRHTMTGRSAELAAWAQEWYAQHGRPWLYARQCDSVQITNGDITLDGTAFSSPRLQQTLTAAEASGAWLVAVSAGPETEAESQRLWREEKPDEYFFLEIYGSAVVEYLVTIAGARLCAWADRQSLAVLPHYSPGYPQWDITQQPRLLDLIRRGAKHPFDAKLEVLDSGMLRPKKSLLAVFGTTAHTERVKRLTSLVPCQNCSFARCEFRRAPYQPANEPDSEVAATTAPAATLKQLQPLQLGARYAVGNRALERWARERLTLAPQADGTTDALFRYEGTTCSNMGRALHFHYRIKLGSRADGYPLLEMQCTPAPGDDGYKFMCRYITHQEFLMTTIAQEKPLLGRPLNDLLTWSREGSGAGCYCETSSRQHKWGLALETLHYALANNTVAAEQSATV